MVSILYINPLDVHLIDKFSFLRLSHDGNVGGMCIDCNSDTFVILDSSCQYHFNAMIYRTI